jgi:hypothetical protein
VTLFDLDKVRWRFWFGWLPLCIVVFGFGFELFGAHVFIHRLGVHPYSGLFICFLIGAIVGVVVAVVAELCWPKPRTPEVGPDLFRRNFPPMVLQDMFQPTAADDRIRKAASDLTKTLE